MTTASTVYSIRTPPAKKVRMDSAEAKAQLLTEAVNRLRDGTKTQDTCSAFGDTIANALREIPEGPKRDMAMLAIHQALFKAKYQTHVSDIEIVSDLH